MLIEFGAIIIITGLLAVDKPYAAFLTRRTQE
jgi:hypothetical protein